MRREARVLGALANTPVPHPRLIAGCPDEDVLGAAFYLMEPVEGFNPKLGFPAMHARDGAIRRQMGFALVEGLAELGRVDFISAGLGDFGRPDGFLERQVKRWSSQLEGYRQFEEWPGPRELGGVEKVAAWLEIQRPVAFTPGIMHGDYHLANVMYRLDSPELAAIVDWELATIGDPLIDLGWLIGTWPGPGGDVADVPFVIEPWDGFPEASELIAHYGERTNRDVSAIAWYAIFACFKYGCILEGTWARSCAGKAPKEIGKHLHQNAQGLFRRALRWIERPPTS
jgi:aminoglycoside phosphotransferase (APT) family kinase protein